VDDSRNDPSVKVVRYLPSKEGIVGDSRTGSCEVVVSYLPSEDGGKRRNAGRMD